MFKEHDEEIFVVLERAWKLLPDLHEQQLETQHEASKWFRQ